MRWISLCAVALVCVSTFGSTAMAGHADGWKLTGSQGVMHLVEIEKANAGNEDTYWLAAAELCGVQPICQVLFWIEGDDAPQSLPMTDAQVEAQAAHWQYNSNTGLRRFLWSCNLFPQIPTEECL